MIPGGALEVAVRPLRRPGAMPPLFLVSAPGVNALGYVALARALGPAEAPCAVQASGDGHPLRRDYAPDECAALAAAYLAAVRGRQPRGPYYFAGMCDGAHLAFEMARQLEASGERVALLAILDTWPVENSAHYPLMLLEALRRRLGPLRGRARLAWVARALQQRLRRLGRALSAQLPGRRVGAPPPSERQRWRARAWPGRDFVPPRYGGRITVLRVRRQPYWRLHDRSLGWAARSAAEVEIHVVPGEHGSLLRKPQVTAVARTLGDCLVLARRESRGAAARGEIPGRA